MANRLAGIAFACGVRLRTLVLEIIAVSVVPLVLVACTISGMDYAALASMLVALLALGLFFVGYEASVPGLHDAMPTVVLAALAAAGRILFAPVPDFKPVSAIAVIAGVAFGRKSGFMVGALAALVSNFFFGQGPWTPWQMYAWGMVGYGAGLLSSAGLLERRFTVCAYGFFSALAYGFVINFWSILGFFHAETGLSIFAVYAAALPFDIVHGVATAAFLLVLYEPWRRKLRRVKAKYGIG